MQSTPYVFTGLCKKFESPKTGQPQERGPSRRSFFFIQANILSLGLSAVFACFFPAAPFAMGQLPENPDDSGPLRYGLPLVSEQIPSTTQRLPTVTEQIGRSRGTVAERLDTRFRFGSQSGAIGFDADDPRNLFRSHERSPLFDPDVFLPKSSEPGISGRRVIDTASINRPLASDSGGTQAEASRHAPSLFERVEREREETLLRAAEEEGRSSSGGQTRKAVTPRTRFFRDSDRTVRVPGSGDIPGGDALGAVAPGGGWIVGGASSLSTDAFRDNVPESSLSSGSVSTNVPETEPMRNIPSRQGVQPIFPENATRPVSAYEQRHALQRHEERLEILLMGDASIHALSPIRVTLQEGIATVRGVVADHASRLAAGQRLLADPVVKQVDNRITPMPQASDPLPPPVEAR